MRYFHFLAIRKRFSPCSPFSSFILICCARLYFMVWNRGNKTWFDLNSHHSFSIFHNLNSVFSLCTVIYKIRCLIKVFIQALFSSSRIDDSLLIMSFLCRLQDKFQVFYCFELKLISELQHFDCKWGAKNKDQKWFI